jgi:hypothetical protein
MKIERHETGPRMSKAVIHGDTVYLAGIVADRKVKVQPSRPKAFCRRSMASWPRPGPTRLSSFPLISGLPTWPISLR